MPPSLPPSSLSQALKHEVYHHNPLALWLIGRALANPELGDSFYWYLTAELTNPRVRERYSLYLEVHGILTTFNGILPVFNGISLYLEVYLRYGERAKPGLIQRLLGQRDVLNVFRRYAALAASSADRGGSKQDQSHALKRAAEMVPLPEEGFSLPFGTGFEVTGVLPEKFFVTSSKHLVLMLSFLDASRKPFRSIFKCGEGADLRQDQIALHILGVMDRIWRKAVQPQSRLTPISTPI